MGNSLNRREFLIFLSYSMAGISVAHLPIDTTSAIFGLGRVAVRSLSIYHEPSFRARKLGPIYRDDLITLIEEIQADEGPSYNPIWYRTPHGYTHSGNLQIVSWHPQPPITYIPEDGALFEVSVPYTRTYRKPTTESSPLYRLFFGSNILDERNTSVEFLMRNSHPSHPRYHGQKNKLKLICMHKSCAPMNLTKSFMRQKSPVASRIKHHATMEFPPSRHPEDSILHVRCPYVTWEMAISPPI